jgi:hypothetical protein
MNSLGGVGLLSAIVWFYASLGTFDMRRSSPRRRKPPC